MGLFDGRRQEMPEWQNSDPKIRRAAVATLDDPSILSHLAKSDADDEVRHRALEALQAFALADNPEKALAALEAFSDESRLMVVARRAAHEEVARAAFGKLRSPRALAGVARQGRHLELRVEAVALLAEPEELGNVALKAEEKEVALAALERIASMALENGAHEISVAEILGMVAERARNKAAARRARALLRGGEAGEAEGVEAKRPTDRRRQSELCEAMEALASVFRVQGLQERINQIRGDWIDLVPEVDPDLEQRFDASWQAAKEHLARREHEESERKDREAEEAKFRAERVAPRLALIQRVETMGLEEAEGSLVGAREDWNDLRVLDTEEGELLRQRFESACASWEDRLQALKKEKEAARIRTEREAARREKESREKGNLRRLEQLCARGEKLLAADAATLKAVSRGLREIRMALESPGSLPRSKERAVLTARLSAIQAGLAPRLVELRQSEAWKHWANEEVQEELCRRAEALSEAADPTEAGRQLTDLQTRWRQASVVSRERSQDLWQRFKAARDAVRARMEATQAHQAARKESLCQQAEALASSTEWVRTADALKRLQAEWKTVGSAGRALDRAIWGRFRAACDQFFTRRKQDIKKRREDWEKNLQARVALCEQAEALADSTDWEATAPVLKRLQLEWKAIGPVSRKDSEPTWHRFRGACDKFFDRYKRRHEIEREARAAQREKLCADLEAFLSARTSAAPEGLLERLRACEKAWAETTPVPSRTGQAFEARFLAALDGVIAAFAETLKDTEYDSEKNRQKMEELVARVEKLASERSGVDPTGLSPAARLAALWVEAMAANTIGGSVGSEAPWRAAQEEVRRTQDLWQRIGYVPVAVRRDLAKRFHHACDRILQMGEGRSGSPVLGSGTQEGR